jgi:hypothetical protein
LEPFGLRSVFLIGSSGNKIATDKVYMGSIEFILRYGYLGYFTDLNAIQLFIVLAILLVWFTFLAISFYGMFLIYKYNKFVFWLVLIYCLILSGIYALTVLGPRYFLPILLFLMIPFSCGFLNLKEKIISKIISSVKHVGDTI